MAEGRVAEDPDYNALLEEFGAAWSAGDPYRIASLFTEGALFLPDPFRRPLIGRAAISEYWKDIPLEQAEVSFRFGEVFVAGPWFATEFKSTFRRRRTGDPVDVRGSLFCETEHGKIGEMRMYWHRRVGVSGT